eukprot:gene17961-18196_t
MGRQAYPIWQSLDPSSRPAPLNAFRLVSVNFVRDDIKDWLGAGELATRHAIQDGGADTPERAVRLLFALEREEASRQEALASAAAAMGCTIRQLSGWVERRDTAGSQSAPARGDLAAPERLSETQQLGDLRAAVAECSQHLQSLSAQLAYSNERLRKVELYLLYLMRHCGVEADTLGVPQSDSQMPARRSDIGFMKLDLTNRAVGHCIRKIRSLDEDQCRNARYIEHELLPELGLSEEEWSFPQEVAHLSGKGLHLLQLPCQVAPFLAWLADNARGIETYLEIGVRWGGTFILITEWLRRFSPEFRRAAALDPADMSPLVREYIRLSSEDPDDRGVDINYIQEYSTSEPARIAVMKLKPDFVFIDGDHGDEGVSHDYELIRDGAKMIMFHDICAPNWPGVGRVWRRVLRETSVTHSSAEFTQQYQTGDGGGMGIGVVRKLDAARRPGKTGPKNDVNKKSQKNAVVTVDRRLSLELSASNPIIASRMPVRPEFMGDIDEHRLIGGLRAPLSDGDKAVLQGRLAGEFGLVWIEKPHSVDELRSVVEQYEATGTHIDLLCVEASVLQSCKADLRDRALGRLSSRGLVWIENSGRTSVPSEEYFPSGGYENVLATPDLGVIARVDGARHVRSVRYQIDLEIRRRYISVATAARAAVKPTVPEVAVFVLTYKHERYIVECLRSIISQRGQFSLRVLIIDDASPDETAKVVREFIEANANSPVKFELRVNPVNSGASANWGPALKWAEGADYATFIDGDDFWISNRRIQKHIDFMRDHPGVLFTFNSFTFCADDGGGRRPGIHLEGEIVSADRMVKDNPIGHFGAGFYSGDLVRMMPLEPFYYVNGDWMTNVYCSQFTAIGYLDEELSAYRLHAGGVWSLTAGSARILRTIDVIFRYNEFTDYVYSDGFNWFLREQYKALGALYSELVDKDAQLDVIFMHDRAPKNGEFLYDQVDAMLRAFPSSVVLAKIDCEFNRSRPDIGNRIIQDDEGFPLHLAKVVYVATLTLTYHSLDRIEAAGVPFMFELQPGGGFVFDHPDIDLRLKRIAQSPYFVGVVVASEAICSYVTKNGIFSAEQAHLIPGRGVARSVADSVEPSRKWVDGGKPQLDICFVGTQNTRVGEDGCYGLFVEVANELARKRPDVRFHVIGTVKATTDGAEFQSDRFRFYGEVEAEKLRALCGGMDIVLSLNASGRSFAPELDGRSLDRVIVAALDGAAIFTSADASTVDPAFADGRNFVRVKNDAADVVSKIEQYATDRDALRAVAEAGAKLLAELARPEVQMAPRIRLLNEVAQKTVRLPGARALKAQVAAMASELELERARLVAAGMRTKRWFYLARGGLRFLSGRSNLKPGQLVQILRSAGPGGAARAILVSGGTIRYCRAPAISAGTAILTISDSAFVLTMHATAAIYWEACSVDSVPRPEGPRGWSVDLERVLVFFRGIARYSVVEVKFLEKQLALSSGIIEDAPPSEQSRVKVLEKPVLIAEPLLPDLADLVPMLHGIWERRYVTNHGPLHQRLEEELRVHLGAESALLFCNGTIGLMTALKLFDLPPGSEVITTPMTFAATAHSICWNGLTPVFADILPGKLTLDPEAVLKAITPNTSAILGVHVYGTLCDVEAFARIGAERNIRILYDAAHAFGATKGGVPISQFGDASIFSLHATKLFNTLEGGLIATPDAADREKIYYLRNFGIKNEDEVLEIGINGKMNEVQAAVGLLNLGAVAGEKAKRRALRRRYCEILAGLDGVQTQPDEPDVDNSEQYFPLVIDESVYGRNRDELYEALKARNVFSRKYFHPICTDFVPYQHMKIVSTRETPYAEIVKKRVLCLPFHSNVGEDALELIAEVFHGSRYAALQAC